MKIHKKIQAKHLASLKVGWLLLTINASCLSTLKSREENITSRSFYNYDSLAGSLVWEWHSLGMNGIERGNDSLSGTVLAEAALRFLVVPHTGRKFACNLAKTNWILVQNPKSKLLQIFDILGKIPSQPLTCTCTMPR